ncbi:MAG: SDR family NAD(P)-dependent oxidoreductase [Chloroflexi bacterium]|nr:SDR family NAD(P)-dependent oxidoreductase [Chloroflexota bacterium]
MSKYEVKGKNVLITGAASGIGREFSKLFAADGANLVLDDLPAKKEVLAQWAKELAAKYNINTWSFSIDLSTENGPEQLYASAREAAGSIDVLMNDAGTLEYGNFSEIDYARQVFMVKTNALALFKLTWLALQDMKKAGGGRIINMSSCAAFQPTLYHAAYGASKAFVQNLSETVNAELSGTGIKVFAFSPPYTRTPLLKAGNLPEKLRWFAISGLWDPAVIAKQGYKAFKQGKTMFIPGPMNWLMHSVIVRLTPHSLLNMTSKLMMKG